MRRVPVWVWRVVSSVGLTLVLLTTTARLTLLEAGFDEHAISAVDGYERLYTDVLPAPGAQAAIRQAVAGLPVDPAYISANVRLLLPPTVVQKVTDRLLSEYVDVVLGRAGSIDVEAVLQPVADNAQRLVDQLLPGTLATAPRLDEASLAAFEQQVQELVAGLGQGSVDLRLPSVRLTQSSVAKVADVMTTGLPTAEGAELRERVTPLLLAGDLGGAFALVLPAYLDDAALQGIAERVDAGARLVVDSLPTRLQDSAPRPLLPIGLGWLTFIGCLLTMVGLVPLLERRGQRLRQIGLSLGIGVLAAIAVGVLALAVTVDPLRDMARHSALSPQTRRLIADVDDQLRRGVTHTYLELTALVAVVAFAFLVAARVLDRARERNPRLLVGGSLTLFMGLGAVLAVAAAPPAPNPLACNGSARLCARPYNEVAYLTSHNAMSSSDRGFLAAGQDPDITGQLDNGVRGLMLDLHYWTTPAEAAPILASLDPQTRKVLAPLVRNVQAHPGIWLCHVLCQIGADPARQQLAAVGSWLAAHPDEVVTLILEDDVSASDVQATIAGAGLGRYLATPPVAGQPWPTLRQMIESGHRLMVFTQRAKLETGPIRNFYQYAAETPFEADRASAFSCAPGRGAATAPLFLVNNWVTSTLPSRSTALAVNGESFLLNRIRQCDAERSMRANFVAVDFAQVGRPLRVVDALNATPE